MTAVEIRGSGESWACYVSGVQVDKPTNAYEKACIKAEKIERELQRRVRACLCCAVTFLAEGRHNRMCPGCTGFAAGAMV